MWKTLRRHHPCHRSLCSQLAQEHICKALCSTALRRGLYVNPGVYSLVFLVATLDATWGLVGGRWVPGLSETAVRWLSGSPGLLVPSLSTSLSVTVCSLPIHLHFSEDKKEVALVSLLPLKAFKYIFVTLVFGYRLWGISLPRHSCLLSKNKCKNHGEYNRRRNYRICLLSLWGI